MIYGFSQVACPRILALAHATISVFRVSGLDIKHVHRVQEASPAVSAAQVLLGHNILA